METRSLRKEQLAERVEIKQSKARSCATIYSHGFRLVCLFFYGLGFENKSIDKQFLQKQIQKLEIF